MLPKLRVMLAALFATSLVALGAGAGLFGGADSGKAVGDVPEVSRPLVQGVIVEPTERRDSDMLASSRRADELQRLRELPASPTRGVADSAEQNAAENAPPAETASAPAAPASTPTVVAAAASPSTDATLITGAIQPAAAPTAPAEAAPQPAAAEPASRPGGAKLAAVAAGTEATDTAAVPDQHKAKRHRAARVRRLPSKTAGLTTLPPQAATGFPIEAPTTAAPTRITTMPNTAQQPRTAQAAQAQPKDPWAPGQSHINDTTLDTHVEGGR